MRRLRLVSSTPFHVSDSLTSMPEPRRVALLQDLEILARTRPEVLTILAQLAQMWAAPVRRGLLRMARAKHPK